jgi:MOSC domain-containing protein YiiM
MTSQRYDRHELERLFRAQPGDGSGALRLICLRKGEGRHERPPRVRVSAAEGVLGDRWIAKAGRDPDEQVTLMSYRVAELIAEGAGAALESAGDNFLVELDLGEAALPVGTRLALGGAILEVSAKPHTGCKIFRERFGMEALHWVNEDRTRRLRGMNCRVVQDGEVALGDRCVRLALG